MKLPEPISQTDFYEQVGRLFMKAIEDMDTEPFGAELAEFIVDGKQTCKVTVDISFMAFNRPKHVTDEKPICTENMGINTSN